MRLSLFTALLLGFICAARGWAQQTTQTVSIHVSAAAVTRALGEVGIY